MTALAAPLQVRVLTLRSAPELERIEAFYREQGYTRGVQYGNRAVLGEIGAEIACALRLAFEGDVWVLRGMRTRRELQRRGIGTQVLQAAAAALGGEACYCIPYPHLVGFYGQVGFAEVEPERAPRFLAERLQEYRAQGEFCLMLRPGSVA